MFDSFEPEMTSVEEFMDNLSRNLEAVEMFKRKEETQVSVLKSRLFWTIVAGIIASVLVVLVATCLPSAWPPTLNILLVCLSESMLCFCLVFANLIRF